MGKLSSLLKKALDALVPNKRKATTTSAIIVAGGSSTRMGGTVTKQMLEICGKPVVVHTLLAFENTPEISEIIVVAKKEETELYDGSKIEKELGFQYTALVDGMEKAFQAFKGVFEG